MLPRMDVDEWLGRRDGIAHRRDLAAAGFTPQALRRSSAVPVGQRWLAVPSAPGDLVEAARVHGRLACISAARRVGLAALEPPVDLHIWVPRNARAARQEGLRLHRSAALEPCSPSSLVVGPADLLSQVAVCLGELEALIVWESALKTGLVSAAAVARIAWPGPRQRRLAALASDRSDSLLETIVAYRLRAEGLPFQQQAVFWGRPVDFLVADRLVLQIDGYAFHKDAAQRRSDIEFDARLLAAGRPVIRRDYAGVVHAWPAFARDIRAALRVAGNSAR
jgi:G:T-mismatch repair DNA endonuclease (very short patch repair protein)